MFVTDEVTQKILLKEIKTVKCDICKKSLFKNKQDEDEVAFAQFKYIRSTCGEIKSGDSAQSYYECESSDFCEKCYRKIISFIKKIGGKVPSYYFSEESEMEEMLEILFDDE